MRTPLVLVLVLTAAGALAAPPPPPLLRVHPSVELRQVRTSDTKVRLNDFQISRSLSDYSNRLTYRPRHATLELPTRDYRLREVPQMPLRRSPFYRLMMRLPGDAVWLDVGAGWAGAQQDYAAAGGKARLVALSAKRPDSQADAEGYMAEARAQGQNVAMVWSREPDQQLAAFERAQGTRFRYVEGYVEQHSREAFAAKVGRVNVITDNLGALAYTQDPLTTLDRYAHVLKKGGYLFLSLGKDSLQLQDRAGRPMTVQAFLGSLDGFKVVRDYPIFNERNRCFGIVLKKTRDEVRVPSGTLIGFSGDGTPRRAIQLD